MFKDKIRFKDIKSIVLFSLAYPMSWCLKLSHKDIWFFSERPSEARDNAYVLFKFIQDKTTQRENYYLIEKDSPDLDKLREYKNVIYFNSFKHYIYYLAAKFHISAHVDSNSPNSRVSNFLETHGLLHNKRVFLQHGVTKDKISFGYYNICRADLFVCAAQKEYEFCKEEFGFPSGNVQLLGFPRFDELWSAEPKKRILLMPTWRAWLAGKSESEFLASEYFLKYSELLRNSRLIGLLEDSEVDLFFLPHSDMKTFVDCFRVESERIKILDFNSSNIQELIKDCSMLITDYSSVAFDFAYMNKPLLYYQFDYNDYRKYQHPEGYFSYEKDGFGPVVDSLDKLCDYLESKITDFNNLDYEKRVLSFFNLRDKNNCKRVYNKILEMENNSE